MPDPVWHKGRHDTDEHIMRYLAGDDVVLDRVLFPYDLRASAAHVGGLARIGLVTADEAAALTQSLDELAQAFEAGDFVLDDTYEDGHSAIEDWLTRVLGDTGRKVHTGRSRNDQVLVATRLYLRDALTTIAALCAESAAICLDRAEAGKHVPMPGYTHLQRAVVSSVGAWFAGLGEAFIDNAALATSTCDWIDANPLGTAAGFGVNLPLDRAFTTRELGFTRMQVSATYAQNSRGKFELQTLMALTQALMDVRRLAWDLSLFMTAEYGFVTLPDRYTTGSSIMPNKRNPDLVELMRAACAQPQGAIAELQTVLALPGGYHRDLQGTKEPVVRALTRGIATLELVPSMLADLVFDEARLVDAIDASMYATDRAMELAARNVPFREAYRQVADELDSLGDRDPLASIAERVSPGGMGNLCLDTLRERLNSLDTARQRDAER